MGGFCVLMLVVAGFTQLVLELVRIYDENMIRLDTVRAGGKAGGLEDFVELLVAKLEIWVEIFDCSSPIEMVCECHILGG